MKMLEKQTLAKNLHNSMRMNLGKERNEQLLRRDNG